MIPPNYPKRIKDLRLRLGFTQVVMAGKLGVSFPTVNRWENSKTKPSNLAWDMILDMEKETRQDDCIKELALRLARCRENRYAAGADETRDMLIVALADKVVELQDTVNRLKDTMNKLWIR